MNEEDHMNFLEFSMKFVDFHRTSLPSGSRTAPLDPGLPLWIPDCPSGSSIALLDGPKSGESTSAVFSAGRRVAEMAGRVGPSRVGTIPLFVHTLNNAALRAKDILRMFLGISYEVLRTSLGILRIII